MPGRGNQTVIKLRAVHAVKLRGLVMLVDVANRHEIDTGRTPVELVHNLEVYPDLLDLGRTVPFVVRVECDAAVLELDLRIEDDVGSDRVGREKHDPVSVEAFLPLTIGSRILLGAEFDFAIRSDAETGNG